LTKGPALHWSHIKAPVVSSVVVGKGVVVGVVVRLVVGVVGGVVAVVVGVVTCGVAIVGALVTGGELVVALALGLKKLCSGASELLAPGLVSAGRVHL
jgi:hypothetical protein